MPHFVSDRRCIEQDRVEDIIWGFSLCNENYILFGAFSPLRLGWMKTQLWFRQIYYWRFHKQIFDRWANEFDDLDEGCEPDEFFSD